MKNRLAKIISALVLLASSASASHAGVVTFGPDAHDFTTQLSSGGLTFTTLDGWEYEWTSGGPRADNGTPMLIYAGETLKITRTGGGAFSLLGFDAGLSFYTSGNAYDLTINDTKVVSLSPSFQTYEFSSFANVTSITLSNNAGGYVAIDNVVFENTPVPEPASLALLGLGLAGVAAARRKSAK